MRSSQLTAVSLFSGAGGLDLGLEQAGWRILAQIEADGDAADTLHLTARRHRSQRVILASPIEGVSPEGLRKQLGLGKSELGLLAGGPPCQPFTTTGKRQAINDRRAHSLFPAYLSYVDAFLPSTFLLENVDGMLSAALRHRPLHLRDRKPLSGSERKGSFLRWFLEELVQRGYSISWNVGEAADYGVPQLRQRAILIGTRGGMPCFLPHPSHGPRGRVPYRTVREALAHVRTLGPIQPLSARKCAVYDFIPPGGNWRCLPEDVQRTTMGKAYFAEGGRGGWWRRLSWDAPSPTVLGMPDHSSTGLIHPDEVRCLSVNECAALQTFPSSVRFAGSPRSQYQQIGNAVPPRFAAALGSQLRRFVTGATRSIPLPPEWSQASANRRIGTHGWVEFHASGPRFHLLVKPRADHVWAEITTNSLVA